jgi:hypothetical protein
MIVYKDDKYRDKYAADKKRVLKEYHCVKISTYNHKDFDEIMVKFPEYKVINITMESSYAYIWMMLKPEDERFLESI